MREIQKILSKWKLPVRLDLSTRHDRLIAALEIALEEINQLHNGQSCDRQDLILAALKGETSSERSNF